MKYPEYMLIEDMYFISFSEMRWFYERTNKLIPLKLIDGHIYYQGQDHNTKQNAVPTCWFQFHDKYQSAIDEAYRAFVDEAFERQILLKSCSCRRPVDEQSSNS